MEDALNDLAKTARGLALILRRQARRPFVLEITGTPKAGKTTLISLVETFLRDCGWRVQVLKERAGECPLPMKGHFFFNTWTTGTMLAGLLDAVDRDHDIVILDRGIFDALVWLGRQHREGQVADDELKAFREFVLLDRWRKLVDLVCTLEVGSETALARESSGRLLPREGSVMNPKGLENFNRALEQSRSEYAKHFDFQVVSNDGDPKKGAHSLLSTILPRITSWADPPIAALPATFVRKLIPREAVRWNDSLWQQIEDQIRFHARSRIESDDDWVQLVSCGVQTESGKAFLGVRQSRRETAPRNNRAMLWRGCHVPEANGPLSLGYLKELLVQRLKQDLHLGSLDADPVPLGLIWTPEEEMRHLGFFFEVPVGSAIASFLQEKEFRTNGRGYNLRSSFLETEEIQPDKPILSGYTLERWSTILLEQRWLQRP